MVSFSLEMDDFFALFMDHFFIFYASPCFFLSFFPASPEFNVTWNRKAYLVSVAKEEVLGTDVLVRVFGLLLPWGLVGFVLPVFGPETVCVYGGNDDAGDNDAVWRKVTRR